MKFGKSIGEQQEGHEDLHYVDYKLLKRKIKDVSARLLDRQPAEALTANAAFEEELAQEIQKVNVCFASRQEKLLSDTARLAEELQRKEEAGTPSSSSTSPAREAVTQLPASLQRLVVLLTGVDNLRKYAVWNAVAIVKILKKRRKQTSFGLEDAAAERAGWLSRQTFFNGSDFAELHTAIESLGHALVLSEFPHEEGHVRRPAPKPESSLQEQCPICLNTISDMVELGCQHRFCWKCFVLGPIAFQPGEYQITQCPICRRETSLADGGETRGVSVLSSQGMLTRFLHTYFPPQDDKHGDQLDREMQDVVGDLVKVILADSNWQQSPKASSSMADAAASAASPFVAPPPRDFFETLPPRVAQDRQQIHAAQKLQWLQLASYDDPLAVDSAMCCPLCSEPLLMEAVVTTPCKHHFHRVCVGRLEMPSCPLCSSSLPFSWYLPAGSPFAEKGFRVVRVGEYRPSFPGGPGAGNGGYPLHKPPPETLLGAEGLVMTSYLHRAAPIGSIEDSCSGTPRSSSSRDFQRNSESPRDDASSGTDSSAESDSEDDGTADEEGGNGEGAHRSRDEAAAAGLPRRMRSGAYAYSALGPIRLYRPAAGVPAGRCV